VAPERTVPTFKIVVAYDGTEFVGWQRQAGGLSVQGLLEAALSAFDGRSVAVVGAGRTDAGVHALGQVASFTLERQTSPGTLVAAVNARLPPAIRVIDAVETDDAFHARYQARSKRYRYRIWNGAVMSPFEQRYAWHVTTPLDCRAMAVAAQALAGRHDFAAFQSAGSRAGSTVRTVLSSRVEGAPATIDAAEASMIVYEIAGNGFLRHMVRTIVGTLVEIGRGRWQPSHMATVVASHNRADAGPTAPPSGLFLVSVEYGDI
jgi:tRNA pseudouridine38-40 synthase